MGTCPRAKVVFGLWFTILGAADRLGAGGVAADSGDVAGLDRLSQRLADLPDGEQSHPSLNARATADTSNAPVRSILLRTLLNVPFRRPGAFFFP